MSAPRSRQLGDTTGLRTTRLVPARAAAVQGQENSPRSQPSANVLDRGPGLGFAARHLEAEKAWHVGRARMRIDTICLLPFLLPFRRVRPNVSLARQTVSKAPRRGGPTEWSC